MFFFREGSSKFNGTVQEVLNKLAQSLAHYQDDFYLELPLQQFCCGATRRSFLLRSRAKAPFGSPAVNSMHFPIGRMLSLAHISEVHSGREKSTCMAAGRCFTCREKY